MSLRKKLGKVVKTASRAVAAYYTAGASEAYLAQRKAAKAQPVYAQETAVGSAGGMAMSMLPTAAGGAGVWGSILQGIGGMAAGTRAYRGLSVIPGAGAVGGAVMAGGRMVVAGARSLGASANTYCRRHPAWCASIGGIPGVVGLLESGQLPTIRRRRGRGITSREMRSFRKVHRVLSQFCAPRMRIRRKAKPC